MHAIVCLGEGNRKDRACTLAQYRMCCSEPETLSLLALTALQSQLRQMPPQGMPGHAKIWRPAGCRCELLKHVGGGIPSPLPSPCLTLLKTFRQPQKLASHQCPALTRARNPAPSPFSHLNIIPLPLHFPPFRLVNFLSANPRQKWHHNLPQPDKTAHQMLSRYSYVLPPPCGSTTTSLLM